MPWEYTDHKYTEYTRSTWNESATAYVGWARNLHPYRVNVVRAIGAMPGYRILDLATGPGEPALTLAEQVGPKGAVVGVDISRNMVSIARREARLRGLVQAQFRTMDCTRLSFGSQTFDAVVSCFGFQIFTDPDRVARESYRVMRPGGRIAVSIWGPGERTPLLHAIMGPMLKHAEPDETGYLPTPYELGGRGQMTAFLKAAGFRKGRERRVTHLAHFADAEEYLRSLKRSTPIGHSLSEESAAVRAQVDRETRRNLKRWTTSSGIDLPGEAVIATAEK